MTQITDQATIDAIQAAYNAQDSLRAICPRALKRDGAWVPAYAGTTERCHSGAPRSGEPGIHSPSVYVKLRTH